MRNSEGEFRATPLPIEEVSPEDFEKEIALITVAVMIGALTTDQILGEPKVSSEILLKIHARSTLRQSRKG